MTMNEDETHATFTITRRRSTRSSFALNNLLLNRKGPATVSESPNGPTSRDTRVKQNTHKTALLCPLMRK
jgi:hypothetical protein